MYVNYPDRMINCILQQALHWIVYEGTRTPRKCVYWEVCEAETKEKHGEVGAEEISSVNARKFIWRSCGYLHRATSIFRVTIWFMWMRKQPEQRCKHPKAQHISNIHRKNLKTCKVRVVSPSSPNSNFQTRQPEWKLAVTRVNFMDDWKKGDVKN